MIRSQSCTNLKEFLNNTRFITSKIFSPLEIGKKSSFLYLKHSFEANGYLDYIRYPLKAFEDFGRKPNLTEPFCYQKKVTKSFQAVWVTDKNNPTLVINGLENFYAEAKKLHGYEVVIYTNINPSSLIEQNHQLKLENIKVRNISEIDTEYTQLLDFVISPEKYIEISNNIKSTPYFGLLIDVAKYLIAESNGGIIADFNFHFAPKFEQSILDRYDFIGILNNVFRLENGFFVVKESHHLIFKELLKIIEQMFNNDCILEVLKGRLGKDSMTELFSMLPLSLAYMKANNLNYNNDVLISYGCNQFNHPKSYSPEFLDLIADHNGISGDVDIDNPERVNDLIVSFNNIINQGYGYFSFNCLEKAMIGEDNDMEMSWH